MQAVQLGIGESAAALAEGRIDAFFWSGALPTQGVSALAAQLPIRLLDLADVVGPLCAAHPEYAPGTVPGRQLRHPGPGDQPAGAQRAAGRAPGMPDDLAEALTETMFAAQEELARASRAALTIDPRAAIGTQPVLLHPGAERFYRAARRLLRLRHSVRSGRSASAPSAGRRRPAAAGRPPAARPRAAAPAAARRRPSSTVRAAMASPSPDPSMLALRRAAPEPAGGPVQLVRGQPRTGVPHRDLDLGRRGRGASP